MIMIVLVIPNCPYNHHKDLQEPFRDGLAVSNTEKNTIFYKILKKKKNNYFVHEILYP